METFRTRLPHLLRLALMAMLAFVGISLPSLALAQDAPTETLVDTNDRHFTTYMLISLDALLTQEARAALASGEQRPSFSTFVHPDRYGLIAARDAPYATSPLDLLCLNRETRSLQLACLNADGHHQVVTLSVAACLEHTPLSAILPRGCRPYVSTIEGRRVVIRRAVRPSEAAVAAPDLAFSQPTISETTTPPRTRDPPTAAQQRPNPASARASPPAPPAVPVPAVSGQDSPSGSLEAHRNWIILLLLSFTALVLLLAVAYRLWQAFQRTRPVTPKKDAPAPDETISPDENERAESRETIDLRQQHDEARASLRAAEAKQEELSALATRATERASQAEQEHSQTKAENAGLKSQIDGLEDIERALRDEVAELTQAVTDAGQEFEAAEQAYERHVEDNRQTQERLLEENRHLALENESLRRRLDRRALDEEAARDAAAHAARVTNEARDTLTGVAVPPPAETIVLNHPRLGDQQEESTVRMAEGQLDDLRREAIAPPAPAAEAPAADGYVSFEDAEADLPAVKVGAHPPLDGSDEEGTLVRRPSLMHQTPTQSYPACPVLIGHTRADSPRALTTAMPIAQQERLAALSMEGVLPTEKDPLKELGDLTRHPKASGAFPKNNADEPQGQSPLAQHAVSGVDGPAN